MKWNGKMNIVINRISGGVSKTIPAGYFKFYGNNFLRQDGFQANGVIVIKRKGDETHSTTRS